MSKKKKHIWTNFNDVKEVYFVSFGLLLAGVACIAWWMYIYKHEWIDGGEVYIMLPFMSLIVLPLIGVMLMVLYTIGATVWYYVHDAYSPPAHTTDVAVDEVVRYLLAKGYAPDKDHARITFSLKTYAGQYECQTPLIHDDTAEKCHAVSFVAIAGRCLYSITYKDPRKYVPNFRLNSILNDTIIPQTDFHTTDYQQAPLPGDVAKIFDLQTNPHDTNETMQIFGPDTLLNLMREGYEFDYYAQNDELTLLFVGPLNGPTIEHYIQKSRQLVDMLLRRDVTTQASRSMIRTLIHKAAIIDKQLDQYFFTLLKTLGIFFGSAFLSVYVASFAESALGGIAIFIGILLFLVCILSLVILFLLTAIVLFVPMVFMMLRVVDSSRNHIAVRQAKRAQAYLQQKYSY